MEAEGCFGGSTTLGQYHNARWHKMVPVTADGMAGPARRDHRIGRVIAEGARRNRPRAALLTVIMKRGGLESNPFSPGAARHTPMPNAA